ncbi:MAG: hypothetical protein BWX66_02020 [Deltaproteobacteria bacterium ADurb.Bin058]|nr:MAG: hypothetical protein BWX66_02020 [Deltaproteobacteria bacterium ADurb.Bin058]
MILLKSDTATAPDLARAFLSVPEISPNWSTDAAISMRIGVAASIFKAAVSALKAASAASKTYGSIASSGPGT